MLKTIAVRDLKLGMHLHDLCGDWLDHPFWKTRFTLDDPAYLARLRASGVTHCRIDVAKSRPGALRADAAAAGSAPKGDSAQPEARRDAAPPLVAVQAAPPPTAADSAARTRTPLHEEVSNAATLISRSREAVRSLFNEARMGRALQTASCEPLVADIAGSVQRNPHAALSLARLKTHDDYSYMHSVAVCALMIVLARQLGQGESESRAAGLAGLLHDIGKSRMPLDVLNKPGKLTAEEYKLIQAHPMRGHEILADTGCAAALELDVCLHHHERPDGKGYPDALTDGAISLAAKMGAVCDVYDAITSNRPYKAGWDPADAIAQMAQWAQAGQFDSGVFQALVKSLGIYPVGSLVRLTSGRLAVVVEQHAAALLTPVVKVFFSTHSQLHISPETIDLAHPGCNDRIVERESNRKWKFKHLDELWAGDSLQRIRRAG